MTQIETENPEPRESKASTPPKRVISLGRARIAGLACLPLLLFVLAFARFRTSHVALSGLSVAGLDVSGLTEPEVKPRLQERARALEGRRLRLRVGRKEAELMPSELGLALDPVATSAMAFAVGRSGGVLDDAARYLSSLWSRQRLPAVLRVDGTKLDAGLAALETSLIEDPPFAGGIEVEAGSAKAIPPRSGRKIAVAAARAELLRSFAAGAADAAVALPTERVTPNLAPGSLERCLALANVVLKGEVTLVAGERRLAIEPTDLGSLLVTRLSESQLELRIDTARLDTWLAPRRASLETPARDASFEVSARDDVKVLPGEPGVKLAAEDVAAALWTAAQRDGRLGELPVRHEPAPARSTEQAQALGIKQLVGTFTTRHPCCQPRVDNIHRIAKLLDGLIVDPGQTISVNAVVGPRTQKNGFVLAPSIEDGEMIDTYGGGVSQFATTFFNALFHAGYDIIERQPHTYWFPRYPMGHEATLSWPHPDIVFKNDSGAGLLVKTSFSTTTITVKLYGDTGGRRVSSSVSERRDIIKPAVELLPNREVEPDEEKVKDGGMIGWSVIASRTITFADGTKKEEKRKVTYKPRARRVEVHPCRIPAGELGATGERCPEPVDAEEPAPIEPAHPEPTRREP